MKRRSSWTYYSLGVCLASLCLLGAEMAFGQTIATEQETFFENQVRPLLAERCFSCHGDKEQKGGLRLDHLADMLAGGDSGAAVVPHKLDESLIIQAVRYEGYEMPPDGKLADSDIEILEKWVEMGAFWPNDDGKPAKRVSREKITAEDRAWWAFQPLSHPDVPAIEEKTLPISASWNKNEIDPFIWNGMLPHGLQPAAEADRLTLLRRVTFDLIGLPPTEMEIKAFLSDTSEDAYEKLVDRLLDSPHYGERWARHWLDLVRYADSDGYRIDHYRPHAWQYRDYVIRALNADKPYDRFVQEQIAGDELFPNDPDAWIATGFLRHWIYEYNSRDARGQWDTILNDVTDTTGDVFLGLGMQCAKCHDHKFDPILQKDYYRLRAFFAGMIPEDRVVADDETQSMHAAKLREWELATESIRQEIAAIEAPYRAKAADQAIGRFPPDTESYARKPATERNSFEQQIAYLIERQVDFEYGRLDDVIKGDDKEKRLALKKELASFDHLKPKELPRAMTIRDVGSDVPTTHLPKRKDTSIQPGFLTLFSESDAEVKALPDRNSSGRRTALALWLTQPEHPLATRVIVNRIWQYHFGKGLAPNSSDFGKLGGAPSHPELLDWLATRFVADGWSLKKLHRLILLSQTYRQSSSHPKLHEQQSVDPLNQYYWRSDVRRLDAEQIRDSLLAACGQLKGRQDAVDVDASAVAGKGISLGGEGVMGDVAKRSIYVRVMRNARDPLLDAFDLPLFFSSESVRNTTTTPVQSLLLINSPQLMQYANALAKEIDVKAENADDEQKVAMLWAQVYGRAPSADEAVYAVEFLRQQQAIIERKIEPVQVTEVAQSKIPYRDGLAITIKPNDASSRMRIGHDDRFNVADFTVEAFVQLRSVYDSGAVRTIVSKWAGGNGKAGWGFGVTGKGSRRKPQTLVMQMHGKKVGGGFGEAAIFSDQNIALNTPYYVAASVKLAGEKPGTVTFYLKDLSNDDEPLQSVTVEHQIQGGLDCVEPFTIGGRGGDNEGLFDGLIDDVRYSRGVLAEGEILFTGESVLDSTVGYWRFEPQPGVMEDSGPHQLAAELAKPKKEVLEPRFGAFRDLCHTLLNSNEFLYVR
jgi:hypothetical protein